VPSVSGYEERVIRYVGYRREGGRLLKEYTLAASGESPAPAVLAAGRAAVALSLERVAPPAAPAFSVIHEGEDACYYLAYWWAEGCILHGEAKTAPLATPNRTSALWPHAIACTWELVPVAHEGQAWVRHVLKAPGEPAMDAWAADGWSGSA
jgi:hypothetical protein